MYYRTLMEAGYAAMFTLSNYIETCKPTMTEYGMEIFRWDSSYGSLYGFPIPYPYGQSKHWKASGLRPDGGAVAAAHCHLHPNNSYFSPDDINTAEGSNLMIFMVSERGAYWYDARIDPITKKQLPKDARPGKFWGTYNKVFE